MCEWLMFLMLVFGCDTCVTTCPAYLTLGCGSGGYYQVNLINPCPVRGIQFTLEDCQPVEVQVTARTKGFFAQYNPYNGTVILVSLSGDKILPGSGGVALFKVNGQDGVCSLSHIKILD